MKSSISRAIKQTSEVVLALKNDVSYPLPLKLPFFLGQHGLLINNLNTYLLAFFALT